MFNEATFREMLLPGSGNVNDCVTRISSKDAAAWIETIELADLGENKLWIKLIRL